MITKLSTYTPRMYAARTLFLVIMLATSVFTPLYADAQWSGNQSLPERVTFEPSSLDMTPGDRATVTARAESSINPMTATIMVPGVFNIVGEWYCDGTVFGTPQGRSYSVSRSESVGCTGSGEYDVIQQATVLTVSSGRSNLDVISYFLDVRFTIELSKSSSLSDSYAIIVPLAGLRLAEERLTVDVVGGSSQGDQNNRPVSASEPGNDQSADPPGASVFNPVSASAGTGDTLSLVMTPSLAEDGRKVAILVLIPSEIRLISAPTCASASSHTCATPSTNRKPDGTVELYWFFPYGTDSSLRLTLQLAVSGDAAPGSELHIVAEIGHPRVPRAEVETDRSEFVLTVGD